MTPRSPGRPKGTGHPVLPQSIITSTGRQLVQRQEDLLVLLALLKLVLGSNGAIKLEFGNDHIRVTTIRSQSVVTCANWDDLNWVFTALEMTTK